MDPKSVVVSMIDRSHYHSTLLMCFVLCIGICCAVLPVLPLGNTNSQEDSPRGDLSYSTTRFFLTLMVLGFEIFVLYTIRRRDSLHENQEVFWPLRCPHCADVVGLLTKKNQSERLHPTGPKFKGTFSNALSVDETKGEPISLSKSLPSGYGYSVKKVRYHGMLRRSKSLNHANNSTCGDREDLSEADIERDLGNCLLKTNTDLKSPIPLSASSDAKVPVLNEEHFPLYCKPHQSLLNTFYIFSTIAVVNIPLPVVANIMCLVTLDNSLFKEISLVVQVLLDISFVMLIFSSMIFFSNFYDAAFIDKSNFLYSLAIVFASSFWIAAVKLLYPIGEIMGSEFGRVDYPCHLPGQFGIFVKNQEKALTPFYSESAIIAGAILWQMWSSILPRSCLKGKKINNSQLKNLGSIFAGPLWGKIYRGIRNCFRCRWLISLRSNKEERQNLLPRYKKRTCQVPPLNVGLAVAICITLGVTYLSLSEFLDHTDLGLHETPSTTENTLTYLKWFLQSVFYFPLLAMYRYRIHLTDSAKCFHPRNKVSVVKGLVGGHDRIILLSCLGIFTLNIFRFVSAVGILVRISKTRAEVVLASYTLIFAVFEIYSAWVMTSFLLVVQRQQIRNSYGVKWTLICLIYTGILNATQWLIDNLDIATWAELTMFYGPTQGMVIGVLLEPLTSLYGIHSAMIAYEAYKMIHNDLHSRHMTVL